MSIRFLLVAALAAVVGHAGVPEAATLDYKAVLSGAAEDPPNASPGTGTATLSVDTVARTFLLAFDFFDLTGTTVVAHVHGPTALPGSGTAGVMTPAVLPGFPAGITSGSYSRLFDMTDAATFNSSFLTGPGGGSAAGAAAAFLDSLADGKAYLNIHTSTFGGGEIRGFFTPAAVPLPAGAVLSLSALAILGAASMRRRGRTVPEPLRS